MAESPAVATLAEDLARELGATARDDAPDLSWLRSLASGVARDLASLGCTAPEDHVGPFVARLAPTLNTPFVIYGAGALGRRLAALCVEQGRPPVAFVESAPERAGLRVDGWPVWSPEEARDAGIRTVLLASWASTDAMRAALGKTYGAAVSDLRCEAVAALLRHPPPGEATALLAAALDVVARGRTLSEYLWLVRHADERMDAAVPVNRDVRRVFHVDRYRFAGAFAAGRRVLDCASGTGYGSGWIDRHASPAAVLGIELDADAVAYATRHYASSRVTFLQGDACRLDALATHSRDLVVSFETVEHVADDAAMLRGFARLLTPEGVLVTSTPNDWPVETSPYHVRSYDAARFEQALRRWFDDVTLFAHVVPRDDARGGVLPWRGQSPAEAECLVAVCRRPRPE